jgi:hypothetical protein
VSNDFEIIFNESRTPTVSTVHKVGEKNEGMKEEIADRSSGNELHDG